MHPIGKMELEIMHGHESRLQLPACWLFPHSQLGQPKPLALHVSDSGLGVRVSIPIALPPPGMRNEAPLADLLSRGSAALGRLLSVSEYSCPVPAREAAEGDLLAEGREVGV